MGRKPRNTRRGSDVQLKKRRKAEAFRRTFVEKTADPNLSLRVLAKRENLAHTQVYQRWRRYQAAVTDAERTAACENHSGGWNRTFTPEQESLVMQQVLAIDTSNNNAIREIALQVHHGILTEAIPLALPVPMRVLRHRPPPFSASPSYIRRFKFAHRLSSIRTKLTHARKIKEEEEKRDVDAEAAAYIEQCNKAIQEFGAHLVLNMDETPAKLAEVPRTAIRRTNSGEAAKITTHANERLNVTTFPTISAAGDKLPMCAIIAGTTERSLRKITAGANAIVQKVHLFYSESGWINSGIMLRYLKEVVQPYTRNRNAALILDDYKAHWTDEVQAAAAEMNLTLIPLPNFKGATAQLQPLDVQFNGPLKTTRAAIWASRRLHMPDAEDSYQALIERVQLAYEAQDRNFVKNAFVKAGIRL